MSTCQTRPAFGAEVMTMMDQAEFDRLLAVAGSETEALAALVGCVDRLNQVHAAGAALARLNAHSLPAAIEARRAVLGEWQPR